MTIEAIENKHKLSKADYKELIALNTKMSAILDSYGYNTDDSYLASLDRLKNSVADVSNVLTYVSHEK